MKGSCWKIRATGKKYYPTREPEGRLFRRYSYSDRIRYYWPHKDIQAAVEQLLNNLENADIPLPLLQQYLPIQYAAVRNGELPAKPHDWVIHHIMQVTGAYADACH